MKAGKSYDVAVVGAGVFGAWTARQLRLAGKSVILVDAYGAANNRASSGGESRVIRMGYSKDEMYTRWSIRALRLWKEFFLRVGEDFFCPTGVLWLADETNPYVTESYETLQKTEVKIEKLSREDLERRFPQFALGSVTWGLYEPESGVLMARRAVQAVVRETLKEGADYLQGAVLAPAGEGQLASIMTQRSEVIRAGVFVFACGPWLPKIFPDVLGNYVIPTRQEVFFFGAPAGDARFQPPAFPAWICRADAMYGMPDIENRGVKFARSDYGPPIDPDTIERVVSPESVAAMREYVGRRFPVLKNAPLVESRVCQYATTPTRDLLIDRHPAFSNVWLMAGAGHGFKHGPALGEYAAQRILEGGGVDPRFSLTVKTQERRAP
jgi:monomeric sarcosine oxidase